MSKGNATALIELESRLALMRACAAILADLNRRQQAERAPKEGERTC